MEARHRGQGQGAEVRELLASRRDLDLDEVIPVALADGVVLKEIQAGILSKNEVYRYNCFKVLFRISVSQPQVLYSEWDTFVELIGSRNSYHRSAALQVIANLTRVDTEGRFEDIFDQYFDLLDDESVVTARYLARSAGRIAKSKPHLQARITERLLHIDRTHHEQARKDLIKADAIQSFDEFYEESHDRERILTLAERQSECGRPTTRKAARSFLKKHAV